MRGRQMDMKIPEECPQEVFDLFVQCTCVDPTGRPSARCVGSGERAHARTTGAGGCDMPAARAVLLRPQPAAAVKRRWARLNVQARSAR